MIECSQCGKFLSRRDNLLRHIKIVYDHNHATATAERSPVIQTVTLDEAKNGDESSGKKKPGSVDNEHDDDINQPQNIDRELQTTTNNFDHMSESDDNKSYYKDGRRTPTIREAIKTKFNKIKQLNGNMDIEEGTSPVTMEEAPKRIKLSRATKNAETNNYRKKPGADNNEHDDDDVVNQFQNHDRDFQTTTNNYDHMSESDDNNSYYEDSCGDYSSEDDENIEPTTRKIYWNNPNKLVDRLRELVSTESGQEIFATIAELRKEDIIE